MIDCHFANPLPDHPDHAIVECGIGHKSMPARVYCETICPKRIGRDKPKPAYIPREPEQEPEPATSGGGGGCGPCEIASRLRAWSAPFHDIAIVGHPGRIGGADTELDHQIRVWQALGLRVHICPTQPLDANAQAMGMAERGCIYHSPGDWPSLKGLRVISFCNGPFLRALPAIRPHVKSVAWVNCMTWCFDEEIRQAAQGNIDFHLYQSDHQRDMIARHLSKTPSYRPQRFKPYFHAEAFPFIPPEQRHAGAFRFGRISRPDADKIHRRSFWIYETMTAPVAKEGMILGWSENQRQKAGNPPACINTLGPCAITQQQFYGFCQAVIMSTDTHENLPRVGLEAMASGSVLCVDRRGGWTVLVEDGKTGWLCGDEREFVYKASRLAFEHEERAAMARAARAKLEAEYGMEASKASWAEVFRGWAKEKP